MNRSDFDFELPEKLIAQTPLDKRGASRLLVYERSADKIRHVQFSNIADYLNKGDLLVFNDTRVMKARLHGFKATGGKLECLVERVLDDKTFAAHIKTSKALKPTQCFSIGDKIDVEMIRRESDLFICRVLSDISVYQLLEKQGEMPLPPYITRPPTTEDEKRYQTVYAKETGAVAAPTAGLHFSDEMFGLLKAKGINTGFLTLHVGAGTFQPVRVDNIKDHPMHSEWAYVSDELVQKIKATKANKKRVIAVGTTVVRSLETAALSGALSPYEGETDIFIYPGFEFKVIDGMLTNFHLPQSTLVMLVSAFCGRSQTLSFYQEAIKEGYRFFSYGDTSLLL